MLFKRILGGILMFAGFIMYFFFKHYKGDIIPYPILFFVLSIIIFLLGFLLLAVSLYSADRKLENDVFSQIDDLKRNGERLIIDANTCKIISNNYREVINEDNKSDYQLFEMGQTKLMQGLGSLAGGKYSEEETAAIYQSCIVIRYDNLKTGEQETFVSPPISKDAITLSFYLERQKEINVYVDKTYRTAFYIDLQFLEE
ncbi:hypothetical protein [Polluticaenibacter yanchengensis]|uniref:Uncharacterized protein n=1 Tax=Polluticaenibacter yanchengensis TaxID=3014562 RepID=A0ABT4UJP8_9BACT|nr:hypothetical protein [Chitinophagaceae bacterium LY-5]